MNIAAVISHSLLLMLNPFVLHMPSLQLCVRLGLVILTVLFLNRNDAHLEIIFL